MISTTRNRTTKKWGFPLRNEDGRIVGYGLVEADDRIEAVSRARMVHLEDVLPAIPPAISTQVGEDENTALLLSVGGVVLDWSTSNPEGA